MFCIIVFNLSRILLVKFNLFASTRAGLPFCWTFYFRYSSNKFDGKFLFNFFSTDRNSQDLTGNQISLEFFLIIINDCIIYIFSFALP